MTEIGRRYPLHEFPFARTPEEEAYARRVHYLTGALWAFGAGDEVLAALGLVWQQVIRRASARAPSENGDGDGFSGYRLDVGPG